MAKGKSTWKYNKLLTGRRNYFDLGSRLSNTKIPIPGVSVNPNDAKLAPAVSNISNTGNTGALGLDWSNPFKGANGNIAKNALTSAVGSAVGSIGSSLIGGGLQSGAGSLFQGLGDVAAAIPGPFGAIASAGLNIVGGITNRMFGSKMNDENIAKVESNINKLNNFASNASDFDSLSQNWANATTGMTFDNDFIGKDGWFSNKAKNKANDLRRQIDAGNTWVQNTLNNNAENIGMSQMQNLLGNYAAFGGELNTQGSNFTNGLLYIDNGGSHESNPYEGVPLGIDSNGTPNLVEEGETVFNDYVFSKRLKVPKTIREKYKLRGIESLSFAEASKKLAKESEERPNDPISKSGLEAIMVDLANAQENVRASKRNNKLAFGGNLFADGGGWAYDNSKNDTTMAGNELFAPFYNNGAFDFSTMHADNSLYRQRLDRVASILYKRKQNPNYQYTNDETGVLNGYLNNVRSWNNGNGYSGGINDLSFDKIIGDSLTTTDGIKFTYNPNATNIGLALDGKRGGHYWGATGVTVVPPKKITEKHMLRNPKGNPTPLDSKYAYYSGTKDGYSWADRYKDKYTIANNGAYEETTDKNGDIIRTYYYDPVEQQGSVNRYYKKDNNGKYIQVVGENPYLDIMNSGNYKQTRSAANNFKGTDYYYDPDVADPEYKKLNTALRYVPAVGLGIASITDALGLTNKPDYSNANAILEASKGTGTYQPVRFNPIGNYLTYKPLDRDYYLNKINAGAGASRRGLLNTSGGNRGTALAGILATDNNYMNQIGNIARQAEEYNLAQRQQVEEFNRGTNTTNSQGFLQADTANQRALADLRDFSLRGTMAAAEMRERARLASDQAKSSNLSRFITSLGDIGRENMAWNWRNFGLATRSFGNVGKEAELLTNTGDRKTKANGGKIRRKKGLTI